MKLAAQSFVERRATQFVGATRSPNLRNSTGEDMQFSNSQSAIHKRRASVGLWLWAMALSCSLLLMPSQAWAQGANGSLIGVVADATGAVAPGVSVTVSNPTTGLTRTVTTDGEGRWTVPVLPVGMYQMTFERAGFKTLVKDNVEVEAAVPRTVEAALEPGEVAETVTITEGTELVTPETSTVSRQVTAEQLVQIPTSTRSFTHLLSTEAGVSADLPPVAVNSNGNISPSVNGTRTTSTSLFFNGIDATNITSNEGSLTDNIAPAPETLSEVKLQTSLYDASTGRSGGGNFQLITRSGTNNFNGSAYYFVQNEKFNANDFFFNRDGIERPRARRNEGGFTIGGPVVKDRFFFFGGYQRTQANTAFVPTASSRTVLPAALGLIQGPRTAANVVAAFRQLNPNFQLTEAQISPLTLALLNTMNPATGDFIIPSPRANAMRLSRPDRTVGDATRRDITRGDFLGGNPLVEQRNVFPAEFEQDQFTLKLDGQLTTNNRLSGTFFFADFPGLDPFPDPSSLASPFVLRRADRNRTLAISDTHIFSPRLINEVRFGYFSLNNSRRLDDPFLEITSEQFGIDNPALFFDDSPGTRRLGHFIGRNEIANFSFGGPNDSFNQRAQRTFSLSDNVTFVTGRQTLRFGGDFKRQAYDTNLPEEQATEFEKFENFTQFLAGRATEADTQFGVTQKEFRFHDVGAYIASDFKLTSRLTVNLGLRYEFFGLPEEKNGRIGNFDPSLVTDTENPSNAFIIPNNVRPTGLAAVDEAIAATTVVDNKHTLNGQDFNNFAPRFGFAYSPAFFKDKLVLRGGYGIFFDRPSTAFINTIFSNYPFLREVEVTAPTRAINLLGPRDPVTGVGGAFSQQNPNLGLNRYLPNRLVFTPTGSGAAGGSYVIRDATSVVRDANGAANPRDLATGAPVTGNVAETFEFRAIDRNMRTPYIQQYNLGVQYELARDTLLEVRYVGTKGTKLLQAIALNQGYNLNDPNTPDYIFRRFNESYNAAYQGALSRGENVAQLFPNGPLRNASTERERGRGIAFGFANVVTGNPVDFNLSTPSTRNATTGAVSGGTLLGFEARGPLLGLNIPEALLLQSAGFSSYNSLQVNFQRRLARGFQFNTSYTFSKSIDTSSTDPGSTAGGGRPDVPNAGFTVQNDARNTSANKGLSDFDRTHRVSASFVYNIPTFGRTSRFLTGFQLAGFLQAQSGTPFSIFSPEPEITSVSQFVVDPNNPIPGIRAGSGGFYRAGFGRPNLCGTLDQLRQQGSDPTEQYFNTDALCSPLGEFGNLGRNVLRGPSQKRFDLSLSKTTRITENTSIELRADAFNLFNNVNFANPNSDLSETNDIGTITNTIGGPRVIQFGAKFKF
ncbi:MAG: TonB-dependent receptor [Acidobacteriota bacterium]|nr:TonB-dependent receptor [Acidobacteriota bacterium]